MLRAFLLIACALAALALLIATIGAALALITGHARWIELTWLSIAASLFAIVLSNYGRRFSIRIDASRFYGEEEKSWAMRYLNGQVM
jgi:hypothetical protein